MTPQQHLSLLAITDGIGFLKDVTNWNNFYPLLWVGLQESKGDVMEFGSGGSTKKLRSYCKVNNREFYSYDYDPAWAAETGALLVNDWDALELKKCGLAFVDNSPGESRQGLIMRMKPLADLIVVHDTEIGGAGAYGFDFSGFEYQLHFNRTGGGAGASLLSDKVDVSIYKGMILGGFTFDK